MATNSPPAVHSEVAPRPARKKKKKPRQKKKLNKLNTDTNKDNNVAQDLNSFNIYAKPFIPKMFTIINSLPGRTVPTPPRKGIDYGMYKEASFGPAVGFLPIPPNMRRVQFVPTSSLGPWHYEPYFQHHLHEESNAVRATSCSSRPTTPRSFSQNSFTGQLILHIMIDIH